MGADLFAPFAALVGVCLVGLVAVRTCRLVLDTPSAAVLRSRAEGALLTRISHANACPGVWLSGGSWCLE